MRKSSVIILSFGFVVFISLLIWPAIKQVNLNTDVVNIGGESYKRYQIDYGAFDWSMTSREADGDGESERTDELREFLEKVASENIVGLVIMGVLFNALAYTLLYIAFTSSIVWLYRKKTLSTRLS